jgi:hypothetical protein
VESNGTLLTYKKKGDSGLSYYPGEGHIVLDLGTVPVSGNTKVTLYKPGKKVCSPLLLLFIINSYLLLLLLIIYYLLFIIYYYYYLL